MAQHGLVPLEDLKSLEMTNLVYLCVGYNQISTIALYCSLLPSFMRTAALPSGTLPH